MSHNIEWHAVMSLLAAVGSTIERHAGKVAVTVGSETEFFDPPAHKDIDTQTIVDLRRMLANAGYGADAADWRNRSSGGLMAEAIAVLGGSIQMPTPTATKRALHSRAARGNAPTESSVIEASSGGRTAVGDRRPAAKPPALAVSPTFAPAEAKPAQMGCSGYRIKHGTSDAAIVKAIREHAAKSAAETEDSPWITATNLTDDQLLAVIGWSVLAKTACAKVAQHLSDMSR
jgi:hypothetical protein